PLFTRLGRRAAHRRPPVLAPGFRPRERPGGRDVPHDPELPGHDAGCLGVECRRLPRPLGTPGAVPHQGPGPARDFDLVARRGLEGERAKGAGPLSVRVRVRPKAVVGESEYGGRPVSAPYLVRGACVSARVSLSGGPAGGSAGPSVLEPT